MFTDKRLIQAYENAKVQYFDQNSKYIFFSDIHRGDDSVSDEFTRNQSVMLHALDYYYNNNYTYVEVGDGDELWEYANFKHVRYAHSDIFTVLKKFHKKKRFIMLYGNHNIYLKNSSYVKKNYYNYYDEYQQNTYALFPKLVPLESLILKSKNSRQEILILHGHQGDLMNDQLWFFNMISLRYFWRYLHVVGFRNPSSPARNVYKQHKIERNFKKWIGKHKLMLICGHTHRARFPKENEIPYFNTGCCINTKGIVGIEIINNNIIMVNWRINADSKGALHISRTVMRGPEPIENYHQIL